MHKSLANMHESKFKTFWSQLILGYENKGHINVEIKLKAVEKDKPSNTCIFPFSS